MTLADKVDATRECLQQALSLAEVSRNPVVWTGGKDSSVALALWREMLGASGRGADSVWALNLDTGVKFPEVVEFRDSMAQTWNLVLSVIRPEVDLAAYPLAQDPVQCCWDLKIQPLHQAIVSLGVDLLITGVRGDEHPERTSRSWLEKRSDPEFSTMHPLLHWTEIDIWSYTLQHNMPYCVLYDQGYRSLGCVPCTQPASNQERSGRSGDKENRLHILRSLGYF